MNSPDRELSPEQLGYSVVPFAAAAALISLIVLAGWIWDIEVLKSLVPGLVQTKANAAVGLFAGGVSLLLLTGRRTHTHLALRWLGRGAAGLTLLLSLLTLSQDVFGWNLGIDQLLFRESEPVNFTIHPGRMSWLTALDFVLLGVALLLLDLRRSYHAIQGLAMVSGLVALLSIGRYSIGAPGLLFDMATPMPMNAAMGHLMLALGVMTATANRGFLLQLRRLLMMFGMAVAVLLVLAIGIASFINIRHVKNASSWVSHTQEVQLNLSSILSNVHDISQIVRSYMLTGQKDFLNPYMGTRENLTQQLSTLQNLTADDPLQQKMCGTLRQLVARRLEMADESIRLRREKGINAVIAYLKRGNVEHVLSNIDLSVKAMLGVEERLLAQRRLDSELAIRSSFLTSVILGLFSSGLLFAMILFGRRMNAKLEHQVLERTKELVRSTRMLRMLSDCNQVLIRSTDEKELLQANCDLVVNVGGYRFCFVVYAEHDEVKSLRTMAKAGVGVDHMSFASTWADVEGAQTASGIAIRTGRPAVLNGLIDDPNLAKWRESMRNLGLKSAAALPLTLDGLVLGALVILSTEANVFDEPEMKVLAELAMDISYGIGSLRSQVALMRSEQRYRMLFNEMMEGFCIIEVLFDEHDRANDYRFLEINPAFETQTGLRNAQGKRMRELAPEHEAHWFEIYGKVAVTGESVRFENEAKALNRWYDVCAWRFGRPDSRQVAILFNDITESRRVEEEMSKRNRELSVLYAVHEAGSRSLSTETRLEAIVEALMKKLDMETCGIYLIEPDGETMILRIHRGCSEAFVAGVRKIRLGEGISGRAVTEGRPVFMDISEYPSERLAPCLVEEGLKCLASTPIIARGKVLGAINMGSRRACTLGPSEFGLLSAVGEQTGVLLQNSLLHEKLELELLDNKREETKYRTLIQASLDGFWINDFSGQILDVNEAYCQMLGYTREELLRMSISDVEAFETPEKTAARIQKIIRTGGDRFETGHRRRDGAVIDVDANVQYIAQLGERFFCFIRDITERKRLSNQLIQSERMTSMGTLAAGVAHEIKNPLAYTILALEHADDLLKTLPADDLTSDAVKSINKAKEGARRASDIVKGLSTFSRAENSGPHPVDINKPMEAALSLATNEIKYRAKISKDLAISPIALANDGQMAQVFLNLLINAAHAIKEGDINKNSISVRTWREGDEICASVTDTGSGIPEGDIRKIFEPFFTTKPVGVGTGLGLSIVHGIIHSLGGRIEVQSKVGLGTTMLVRLRAAPNDAPLPAVTDVTPAIEAHEIRGRFLVIDDEAEMRKGISRTLTGCTVIEAENGEVAQNILKTDRAFDLILCDMMMPVLSGVDLYNWLTKEDPALASRVIFITGGACTPEAQAFLDMIGSRKLEKPFNRRTLRDTIAKMLR